MQLALTQLEAHLRSQLHPLYVLHGDEFLLQMQASDQIRQAAKAQGFSQRSIFNVQGAHFDWADIQNATQTMGLFDAKQLIDIRIPSAKPGKDGSVYLQALAEQANRLDAVLTIISLPRIDKATQSSAWWQAIEQRGVSVKIDPILRSALAPWIAKQLHAQGQRVQVGEEGQRALQFFADCVEGNLLAAYQEVQKIALIYPPGEISFAQIQAAVANVARYDVFQLRDNILAGKARQVQRMIDGLQRQGEAAVQVHWTLAEEIQSLKRAYQAMRSGKPIQIVLREQRIWGPGEQHYQRILQRVPIETLNQLLQAAHVADAIVKGLPHPDWPDEPWQALSRLAQQMVKMDA